MVRLPCVLWCTGRPCRHSAAGNMLPDSMVSLSWACVILHLHWPTWHVVLKSCTSLSQVFLSEAASSWFMVIMPM